MSSHVARPALPTGSGPRFIYNVVHWHLLLNHVPVIAVPLGVGFYLWGWFRPTQEFQKAGLALWIFSGLAAIPVYLTGQSAAGYMRRLGMAPALIHAHANAAGYALTGVLVLAAAALLAWYGIHARRLSRLPRWAALALLLLALGVSGLMYWTAETGGYIRHSEIRPGFRFPARISHARRSRMANQDTGRKHQ